mmetsp:Transcript_27400/g.43928  ORF Transcript_27400/g.43928 Transcript_27400/m.43928 type:complete len:556 (-) Transcript_27400:66-1733(-)
MDDGEDIRRAHNFCLSKDLGKLAENTFVDDSVSTCAPPSVGRSSLASTPDLGPTNCDNLDIECFSPLHHEPKVCIVHHDEMQLHTPPRTSGVYELPRRIIAIENCFKGRAVSEGFPKRSWGNSPMQFLRTSRGKRKRLVEVFGSPAAKRRQAVFHTGSACAESVWESCEIVEAPIGQDSEIGLVHSQRHIAEVKRLCAIAKTTQAALYPLVRPFKRTPKDTKGLLGDDNYYAPQSLTAMRRAVGGAVEAVRRLFLIDPATGHATGRSDIESSFAIVRPPGHHCCSDPSGFCYFNNTAIAASYARKELGMPKVAIVDWDYHHGDGQQRLFYNDATVLTISIHVAMERLRNGKDTIAFPGNKSMDVAFNGGGHGLGYNINIPWPHDKIGASEYEEAFQSIVLPALQGFDADLILVASGFDAMVGDTLAGTRLTPSAYHSMTCKLLSLQKPIAVILEGGYAPENLAMGSLNVVHALLGRPPCDACHVENSGWEGPVLREAEGVLEAVRHRLNSLPPWNTMRRLGSDTYFLEKQPASLDSFWQKASQNLTELIIEQASS